MTDKEKEKMQELRAQGFGYKLISKTLCIPIGSVTSFFIASLKQKITVCAETAVLKFAKRKDIGKKYFAVKCVGMNGVKAIQKREISKHIIRTNVNGVDRSFRLMEIRKGNIARGHVIWRRIRKEVRIVNDFEKYLNTLALLTSMRNKDMISDTDFNKAERYISRKYCIKKGSIYRRNDLINSAC